MMGGPMGPMGPPMGPPMGGCETVHEPFFLRVHARKHFITGHV
jgi:hypothetical protein